MKTAEKKTILHVEDDPITALTVKTVLGKFGYSVVSADSGHMAVEKFKESGSIDLVLMDIDLGDGMDGTEAAEQILLIRDIPIVFLSSHTEPDIVEKTERITSYGYVVKNSSNTVLDASIKMAFKLFEAKQKEKAKEDDLFEREELFRSVVCNSSDLTILTDPEGRATFVSPQCETVLGHPAGRFMGQIIPDIIHPDDAEICGRKWEEVYNGEPLYNFEYRIIDSAGSVRWISHSAKLVTIKGRALGMQNSISNITSRKQAEADKEAAYAELKDKELHLKNAQRIAHLGHWVWDTRKQTLEWSDEIYRIFGIEPHSIKPSVEDFESRIHPDDLEPFLAKRELMLRQGKEAVIEHRIVLPDGSIKFVEERAGVEKNGSGDIIRVTGTVQDITEPGRSELLIREYASRLELTMMAANMAWWELDIATGNVLFDKRKSDMLGYPQEKFSHYKDFMELVHPDDNDTAMDAMRGHFEGRYERYETEYRIVTADGIWKWFYDIGTIVQRSLKGRPLKVAGIVLDVTDRKTAEERIKSLLAEKEIILKEVHHRIKNNMSTIMALLNLQAESVKDSTAGEALKDAGSRVQSMSLLYDRLFRSSDSNTVNVKGYFTSLAEEIIRNFPNSGSIKLETAIDDFTIKPNLSFSLGIIINELITNIMKYAFRDRPSGTISFSVSLDGSHVSMIIRDDGAGMPESVDFSGAKGFGLMLVSLMVKQITGTIRIERGSGTGIIIEFDI
jgi:PAS domain S-box-containing protein